VLLVIGLVIKFIWWIIGAAVLIAALYIARAIWRSQQARQDASARRRAELAARADQQHQWVMQGDERGTYGPAGAALMQDFRQALRTAA
jgi:nitrate/nitrite transporter NarK